MEYKYFETPRSHDRAFYDSRPAADHINQLSSALRVHIAAAYATYVAQFDNGIRTVADFGCGTGGLLMIMRQSLGILCERPIQFWGYDLCQANVEIAQARGLDVTCHDIVADMGANRWPDLLVMSEVIEHLIDPHEFLWRIPKHTHVVLTVPCADDGFRHDTTHLWGWTERSFPDLCESRGIAVQRWEKFKDVHQIVVGRKRR